MTIKNFRQNLKQMTTFKRYDIINSLPNYKKKTRSFSLFRCLKGAAILMKQSFGKA